MPPKSLSPREEGDLSASGFESLAGNIRQRPRWPAPSDGARWTVVVAVWSPSKRAGPESSSGFLGSGDSRDKTAEAIPRKAEGFSAGGGS